MRTLCLAILLSILLAPAGIAQKTELRVIEMTARKYEFDPSEIRVKEGTPVQLRIRALDRSHGFSIELYPEGAKREGAPGLRFTQPEEKWTIEKGETQVIEFVAERPGIYPFKCAVFCGFGHRGMKGRLVVEE